jgi:two-component system, chemotaxis family, CheB/CheR fusion protein
MGAAPDRSLAGRIVLVLDDREEMIDLLRDVLGAAGAHVRTSTLPERAIAILVRERVDAIVCDLKMPGMDGLEWIERVRRLPSERRNVPALALTGDPDHIYRDPFTAAVRGFDAHLLKPVEPSVLVAQVRQLLDGHGRKTTARFPRID